MRFTKSVIEFLKTREPLLYFPLLESNWLLMELVKFSLFC